MVRIIAGKWRGRKIDFPALPGLRPTHDRLRETLFNWLMYDIEGKNCLDLFAGSGALGFEALSRGAAHVTFVDSEAQVIKNLLKNAERLEAVEEVTAISGNFPSDLHFSKAPFDLVFLDPPFHQNFISIAADGLEKKHLLKSGALIYIEAEKSLLNLGLPVEWEMLKLKKTSTIQYGLFKRF